MALKPNVRSNKRLGIALILVPVAMVGAAYASVPLYQLFCQVQCFCFTEQRLSPGARADMPVSFFVDPRIDDDPNLDEVKTITLSYTFFPDEKAEAEQQLGRLDAPEAGEGQTVN